MKPYKESKINKNLFKRVFEGDISESEMVWHRDRENRLIIPLHESNWKLQIDNELPKDLIVNEHIFIESGKFHRLIKGDNELVLNVFKSKHNDISELIKEYYNLIKKTPPENKKITENTLNKFIKNKKDKAKESWETFKKIAIREKKETKEAFFILKKIIKKQIVSDREIKFLKSQSKDIAKIVGIMAIGSVSMIIPIALEKVLNKKYGISIMPSSHIIKKENTEVIEEKFFNEKLPKETKKFSQKYIGKKVNWYGYPEQMIVLHKSQIEGMWGNIYDSKKLQFVVDLIKNSYENVEFECSYGIGNVVSLIEIKEEQNSFIEGTFDIDYDGKIKPYSIGDNDLDTYLGDENYISDNFDINLTEFLDFLEKNKLSIAYNLKTENTLREELKQLNIDEEDREIFEEFIKLENELKKSVENKDGDLGKFIVQLRDGHHRVMGAIEAGEEFVCVNLDKNSINEFKGHYKKV